MYRLLIGSGHTNINPGTIYNNVREFDLARKILEITIPHLEKTGIEFTIVPVDMDLLQRIDWINQTGYSEKNHDIFVEIHINDGGKRGIEGWFRGLSSETNKSQRLAEFIVNSLCQKLNFENQGVCTEYDHHSGGLIILNQTNTIGVLIELLYIDNPEDFKILNDKSQLELIGQNLALSIKEYFEDVKNNPSRKNQIVPRKKNMYLDSDYFGNFDDIIDKYSQGQYLTPINHISTSTTQSSNNNSNNLSDTNISSVTNVTQNQSTNNKNSKLLTTEEKKQIIKPIYILVLGREPSFKELDDAVRTFTDENSLIKKLLESEHHRKIISDAQEYKKTQEDIQKIKEEKSILETKLQEAQKMLENLERTHRLKDQAIRKLQKAFIEANIIKKGMYFDPERKINVESTKETKKLVDSHKYTNKKGLLKKIADFFK